MAAWMLRLATASPTRNRRKRPSALRTTSCGRPASEALGGPEHDWECRNEACPEYGQPVAADEGSWEDGAADSSA